MTAAYKRTEVGEIPEDWQCAEIGDLDPFITSGSRGWAEFYSEYGSPFIRITNLSRQSIHLDLGDMKFVNLPPGTSEGTRTQLQTEDVLISITADIGIVGYVSAEVPKPAYINQHIALVRFQSSKVSSRFVSYFLASAKPQTLFRASTDVGAKAGMSLLTVRKLRLALPLVSEQRAIAEALSDVDALIAALDRLIAKKRDLKQAATQQLLTGKRRLPGFGCAPKRNQNSQIGMVPDDWHVYRLDEVGTWKGGATPSMANPLYWQSGTTSWASSSDVKGPRLRDTALKVTDAAIRAGGTPLLPPGAIVVVTRSGILRRYLPVAANVGPLAINQDIKALIPNARVTSDFMLHVLLANGPQILSRCLKAGTTVESIEFGWLKAYSIPVPCIEEQRAIAGVLSDMDAELAGLERKRDKTRLLKQGMMQELLTGRTRLV